MCDNTKLKKLNSGESNAYGVLRRHVGQTSLFDGIIVILFAYA